jgi:magnesium transporter
MIVDCAAYRDGRRCGGLLSFEEAHAYVRQPGVFVWIGLRVPTDGELDDVQSCFELDGAGLEELDLKAAASPHQRPVVASGGGLTSLSLRTAHYDEIRAGLQETADQLARVVQRARSLDDLLTAALDANLTLVSLQQNDDMRRISAWVAIAALPTMIAGIYGMNFEHMPELTWRYGYPAALLLMLTVCGLLYRAFRRSGWL